MSFTNTRSLPYRTDSELYMRALNGLGMPAFLDSANHGGNSGSLDILAAAPTAHLKVETGVLSCSGMWRNSLATLTIVMIYLVISEY